MNILSLVLQCIIAAAIAQAAQSGNSRTVIDNGKPYVYIRLDHLGERKPISEDEMACGLWLRMTNNSRVPIRVRTFDPGTPDPGVGLMHEVVRVVVPIGPGEPPIARGALQPPVGYDLDVGSPTVIRPGQEVLFSVPANHIDPRWYLRVRFELELPPPKSGRQPYSFVEYGWADLPSTVRSFIGMIRDGKCPSRATDDVRR